MLGDTKKNKGIETALIGDSNVELAFIMLNIKLVEFNETDFNIRERDVGATKHQKNNQG